MMRSTIAQVVVDLTKPLLWPMQLANSSDGIKII
jgi:hypothetical protein